MSRPLSSAPRPPGLWTTPVRCRAARGHNGGMANLHVHTRSGRDDRRHRDSANPMRGTHRGVLPCGAPARRCSIPTRSSRSPRDVHIVALDRPGYGAMRSARRRAAGRASRGAADDIAEYLRCDQPRRERQIGVSRPRTIGVAGWSAGGRVALAVRGTASAISSTGSPSSRTPAPNEAVPWIDPRAARSSPTSSPPCRPTRRWNSSGRCSSRRPTRCVGRVGRTTCPSTCSGRSEVDRAGAGAAGRARPARADAEGRVPAGHRAGSRRTS